MAESTSASAPAESHGAHGLQHQFESLGQQKEASTLGMWVFLVTEILFFGGVLAAYWIYRIIYPEAWAVGAEQQNKLFGGINTLVLIFSSLTMALAVYGSQVGNRKMLVGFLLFTIVLGSVFLVSRPSSITTNSKSTWSPVTHFPFPDPSLRTHNCSSHFISR